MNARSVGIREAKSQLSRLLKLVQEEGEVVLTDRGRPVGKIAAIRERDLPLEARIRKLEERGILERAPSTSDPHLPPPIRLPAGLAQEMLREEREDGR